MLFCRAPSIEMARLFSSIPFTYTFCEIGMEPPTGMLGSAMNTSDKSTGLLGTKLSRVTEIPSSAIGLSGADNTMVPGNASSPVSGGASGVV
ncbi:hypothetical protein [Tateyamaria omphalii]|uniref:Uncharacterized protein n=1 Tax=Tateyamaria omphalii TaxID=299262 RepID=A0A1P8MVA9_9RHOB|nr:hypothetical protein BWR18_09780 [Tateyamaria omphalii]